MRGAISVLNICDNHFDNNLYYRINHGKQCGGNINNFRFIRHNN